MTDNGEIEDGKVPAQMNVAPPQLYEQFTERMRGMIGALPVESAGVRERRALIETVSRDAYWLTIDQAKLQVLKFEVAPLMRYLPGVDLATATFDIHCLNCIIALLDGRQDDAVTAARQIREDLIRLPVDHPDVEPQRDFVQQRYDEDWCEAPTIADVLELRDRLGDLMRHRLSEPSNLITLDLADAMQEQRVIEVGPDRTRFEITEYQQQVIERVASLRGVLDPIDKLAAGELLDAAEIEEIAAALNQPELYADEDALQKAWRVPHASLMSILRDILGVEALVTREAAINAAFSGFVRTRNYLQADQLTFVRLFARRLIDHDDVRPEDLLEAPFTTITTDPPSLLPAEDIDELFAIAAHYRI